MEKKFVVLVYRPKAGPACYGMFNNEAEAKQFVANMEKAHPKWTEWTITTITDHLEVRLPA